MAHQVIRILSAGVLILTVACSAKKDDPSTGNPNGGTASLPIPAVESVQARYGSLPLKERLSGVVVADNQVSIYPELSAPITQVLVNDGDRVRKDAALIRLRDDDYRKSLDQATAQYKLAQARVSQANASVTQIEGQYNRTKLLSEKNMVSPQELETQKAQLASAKANLQIAEAQETQAKASMQQAELDLSHTIIRAPVSGYIGRRNAEIGMQVTPATRLLEIGNISKVKVRVRLTEQMVGSIQTGQRVRISSEDAKNIPAVNARLSRISPFLDPVSHTTQAEVDVDNAKGYLKPGMFVAVDVFYGESRQATLVPNSALYQDPVTGVTGIYVASSLNSELKPVTNVDPANDPSLTSPTPVVFREVKLVAGGSMVSAIDGITSGDWVVTVGQDLLENVKTARVRPVTWDRILNLENMKQEDLLDIIMEGANSVPDSTQKSPTANSMF